MYGNDFPDDQMRVRSLVTKFEDPIQATFEMNGGLCNPTRPHEVRGQGMEANLGNFADRWRKVFRANLNLLRHRFGDRVDHVFAGFDNVADRVLQAMFALMSGNRLCRIAAGPTESRFVFDSCMTI
jgi:hypothetical protein